MLKDTKRRLDVAVPDDSFSRVSSGQSPENLRRRQRSVRRSQSQAHRPPGSRLAVPSIQSTKISAPATDCISPIGEALILKGLHHQVPGEFFCAATRPPSVYRGNPFLIEVGLAYGGASSTQKVTLEALTELLSRKRCPLDEAILAHDLRWRRRRPEPRRSCREAKWAPRQSPSQTQEGGNRATSRGDEECQSVRRPIDAGAAVCQSRSAAVSTGGLCDHAVVSSATTGGLTV